jgi:hypothetical protein
VRRFSDHEFRVAAIYGDSSYRAILTNVFAAFPARGALAATPKDPRNSDPLIHKFFGYNGSGFHNAANDFVSGYQRAIDEFGERRPVPSDEVQVRMADSAGLDLQENFAFLRNWARDILKRKSMTKFMEHCCSHQVPFISYS